MHPSSALEGEGEGNGEGNGEVTSTKMHAILARARHLEYFEMMCPCLDEEIALLSGEDMIGSDWATTSLVSFSCAVSVPRVDRDVPRHCCHRWSVWELCYLTVEISYQVQQYVYRELCRQTKPQKLPMVNNKAEEEPGGRDLELPGVLAVKWAQQTDWFEGVTIAGRDLFKPPNRPCRAKMDEELTKSGSPPGAVGENLLFESGA